MTVKNALFCLWLTLCFATACHAQAPSPGELIDRVGRELAAGKKSVTAVLTDTSLRSLHPLTPFRETIKKYARAEKIKLSAENEPGVFTTVRGLVKSAQGEPVANALIYVYQTDHRGWYSDTAAHVSMMEGDRRHARLFGYLKTDTKGNFEFETIRPQSYPNSSLPQHIHFELFNAGEVLLVTELLFDDDPKLTGETRRNFIREGYYVAKNTGTPQRQVFEYQIVTR